jgi:hypothetical protein
MDKLILSMIIGALVMVATGKWKAGDLSAGQVVAVAQDMGRDANQILVNVRR